MTAKREYASIQRGMSKFLYEAGTYVLWYVWDQAINENSVYDEGGRHWKTPRRVPVYSAPRTEITEMDETGGVYGEQGMSIIIPDSIWKGVGLPPADDPARINDRVVYEKQTFSVDTIQLQGRVGPFINVYNVQLTQVISDERFFDAPQ